MPYVDDRGKRTAPKHRSRKAAPPKPAHRVVQFPHGDIASSGGDYGTRKAKAYSAGKAFRGAVRKTYSEQPTAVRKQIARASERRPGPAAAAIRHEHHTRTTANRRAAGTDRVTGIIPGLSEVARDKDIQDKVKLIQDIHRRTPISTTGDTKSDLERITAESFKATPQFQRDFLAGVESGVRSGNLDYGGGDFAPKSERLNTLGISGGVGEGLGRLLNKRLGLAASGQYVGKALAFVGDPVGKITGDPSPYGKTGETILKNIGKEAIDIPAQIVPEVIHTAEMLKKSPKAALEEQLAFPKQLYKDPVGTFIEHPLATGLVGYGLVHGGNRLAGAAARKTGAIPNYRPDKVFPNSPLARKEPTARGLAGGIKQIIQDRPIRRGEQPLRTMSDKEVRIAAHEDEDFTETQRRLDRNRAAKFVEDAVGRKPSVAHTLAAQNIVATKSDLVRYHSQLERHRNILDKKIKAGAPNRIANRAARKVVESNMKDIGKFLNRPEIRRLAEDADFPDKIRQEVEAYKAASTTQQGRLGELYGQTGRLSRARLMPYAVQNMGAEFKKTAYLDTEQGKVVSGKELGTLKKELTPEEFEKRVTPVQNALVDVDKKILSDEDIRRHMARQPGPYDHPEVQKAKSRIAPQLKIEERELARLQNQFLKKYKDLDNLPAEAATRLKKQQGRTERLREDLAKAEKGVVSKTIQLPKEEKFAVKVGGPGLEQAKARVKEAEDNQSIAVQAVAQERYHVEEGQKLYRELKGQGKSTAPIEIRLADAAQRLKNKEADLLEASDTLATARKQHRELSSKTEESSVTIPAVKMETKYGPQGISEPAWVSQAPNRRSGSAYYRNPNKAQIISPSGRTGKATVEGTLDLGKDVLKESYMKGQALISAAELFSKTLERVALRTKPNVLKGLDEESKLALDTDEAHPQVLTIKGNARDARNFADNYNELHPNAKITPVQIKPFGGTHEQVGALLERANSDEKIAEAAIRSMDDSLKGIDVSGSGKFAFVPESYAVERAKYLEGTKAPLVRLLGGQFRKTVLSTSPKWLVGNIVEPELRNALEGAGPRSYYTAYRVLRNLKEQNPEMFDELSARAKTGHFGVQNRQSIYSGAEQFDQSTSKAMRDLARNAAAFHSTPPGQLISKLWNGWVNLTFNIINGKIESFESKRAMGHAIREHLITDRFVKLSKKAMDEATQKIQNPETMAQIGREVDRIIGKYGKFSPNMKARIAHETPFIAWYLNALRFIYKTLPRDHPVATAMIANSYGALDEWRKDKGLGLFIGGHLPYFLQGASPTEAGHRRLPYTPFSAVGDPTGTPASLIFPQYQSLINNLQGKDWKGDDIPGYEQDFTKGVAEFVKSLSGMLIPGARQGITYLTDKREGEDSTTRLRRALGDPRLETKSPAQTKGGSQSKYKIGGASGGGSKGGTTNKYKIGGSSKKGSSGKYKIK